MRRRGDREERAEAQALLRDELRDRDEETLRRGRRVQVGGRGGGEELGEGRLSLMRSIPLASYRNGKELGLSACESVWKELETIFPLAR